MVIRARRSAPAARRAAEAGRADLGVRSVAILVATGTEHLAPRLQMDVDFKADGGEMGMVQRAGFCGGRNE